MSKTTAEKAALLALSPEHYDDLVKSGLSDETIVESGIKSLPYEYMIKTELAELLGFDMPFAHKIKSAYKIPYPGTKYFRVKVFYKNLDQKSKPPKYLQKKDTGNRLYIPNKVRELLQDNSIPLYFTEGEKKSIKACQEGLPCIGISGLWNWSDGTGTLISDFDLINFKNRTIFIVPDNDFRLPAKHGYKKNLEVAVKRLAKKVSQRGAKVFVIELPPKENPI